MRDIKFRAWAFDDEFMVDESYYDDEFMISMDIENIVLLKQEFDQIDGRYCGYGYCKCEIMQYTGLKDKNGVEIYEGDILALDNESERGSYHIYRIEYSDDKARFVGVDGDEVSCMPSIVNHHDGAGCYMVIGNIYENPDLINQ